MTTLIDRAGSATPALGERARICRPACGQDELNSSTFPVDGQILMSRIERDIYIYLRGVMPRQVEVPDPNTKTMLAY